MLVLPHAVTAGASLYIEQEYLIAVSQSRLDLINPRRACAGGLR